MLIFQVSIMIVLGNHYWAQIPAPDRDENICSYLKKEIERFLWKNITTLREYFRNKCGIPSQPETYWTNVNVDIKTSS